MANDKKFAVNNGLQTQNIDFVSADGSNTIQLKMLDPDTLSVSGNSGQLFSITDSLTGIIFAVNDISGVPSIEVFDSGKIQLAELFGNVLIGTSTDNTVDKLQINGSISATILKLTVAVGTPPLVVNSATLVSNLNADLLDGYQSSTSDAPSTVPVRDSNNLISVSGLRITTGEAGYSPLDVARWNALDKTYDFQLLNGVTGQMFQEMFFYGRAVGDIANGDVVMFAGAQGDQALFTKADTSAVGFQPRWVIGVATQNIPNNDWGYVTSYGKVRDLLLYAYPAGTILYLDPATPGGFTSVEPTAPLPKIVIAAVLRQSTAPTAENGILLVRPDFSYFLHDLHDVRINGIQDNQVLSWNASTNRWENKTLDTSIGGSNTQVLFNDTGIANGDAGLIFDKINGTLAIGGKTVTTTNPIINLSQTWNSSGTIFSGLKLDINDTASASLSTLIDLQTNGVSKFKVDKNGFAYISDNAFIGNASGGGIDIATGGSYRVRLRGNELRLRVDTSLSFSSGDPVASGADVFMQRDAAQTLAQRNGTNPQVFRVYNTYTDASNYERGIFAWNANTLEIGTESSGTGTRRTINLNYTTTINGNSRTNVPALTISNVGAGDGGLTLGVMKIGNQQDHARMTAVYVANKAFSYSHAGVGVSNQGIHRFSTDSNGGTSSGVGGSVLDIVAPTTATNIFQCRQADGTVVLNVAYNGSTTIANVITNSAESVTLATVSQSQIASFAIVSFRSAKLLVQVFDSVTSEVQISELLVAHNGTSAFVTEYGVVYTGASALASFDVDISAGNVRLLATRATTNSTQYKVSETLLAA